MKACRAASLLTIWPLELRPTVPAVLLDEREVEREDIPLELRWTLPVEDRTVEERDVCEVDRDVP